MLDHRTSPRPGFICCGEGRALTERGSVPGHLDFELARMGIARWMARSKRLPGSGCRFTFSSPFFPIFGAAALLQSHRTGLPGDGILSLLFCMRAPVWSAEGELNPWPLRTTAPKP